MAATRQCIALLSVLGVAASCALNDRPSDQERLAVSASALAWAEEQKISASDPVAAAQFGSAVALEANTMVVGAQADNAVAQGAGAVYVYVRAATVWNLQQKIVAGDGLAQDGFGASVAISGDTIVVGARLRDEGGSDAGAAYVYVRSGTTWALQQKLVPGDGVANGWFGTALAVAGDLLLIGASRDDDLGASSGSVYAFSRAGVTWSQQQKIHAGDGAANAFFGASVSLSGSTLLIGASADSQKAPLAGAAYAYVLKAGQWTQQQKLVALDGALFDSFGASVSVSGDTAVVGAFMNDGKGADSGSAYVWSRSGDTWTQQQKLVASDAAANDWFGTSVGIRGDTLVVGAPASDSLAKAESGAAYLFTRSGATWTELAKLTGSGQQAEDYFGLSVATLEDLLAVGSPSGDSTVADSGLVYVFQGVGKPCSLGSECASGLCADSHCCDSACTGVCESCALVGKEGLCSPVLNAVDPDSCAGGCNASGKCAGGLGQGCTQASGCASGFCSDGVCCDKACDKACEVCLKSLGSSGDGTCAPAAKGYSGNPTCAPLVCDGVTAGCPVECSGDSQCEVNQYCSADGKCRDRKTQGESCDASAGADCLVKDCRVCATEGNCEDGVCCGTACGGKCDVCALALGASADGVCTIVPATSAGDPTCTPFLCSGTSKDCATTCATSSNCAAASWCDKGVCVGKNQEGTSCSEAVECQSGYCVDGVCCNTACAGQCEACEEQGNEGTCMPVDGAPRSDRSPCAGPSSDDLCSARTCKGEKDSKSCAGWVSGTECRKQQCVGGEESAAASCEATGTCPKSTSRKCDPYVCKGDRCGDSCKTDSDCVSSAQCDTVSTTCVSRTQGSCDGNHTVTSPGGGTIDCSPYRCTQPPTCGDKCTAPTCLSECKTAADCVEGYRCDSQAHCVKDAVASAAPEEESGCGCRSVSRSRPEAWLFLGVLAAGWAVDRRRRR